MSAVFVRPLPFTPASTNPASTLPLSNAALDHPGLVWRSTGLTPYIVLDLGAGSLSYDYVALIGTNLRATDTVQVRTGTTTTGTGTYAGTAVAAWSGSKPALSTAQSIIKLSSTCTERYLRIDLTATGHPDGFVQFSRLVVGKSVVTGGLTQDSEVSFYDRSVISDGAGYTLIDEYDVIAQMKFGTDWISEASWRNEWIPLLQNVGNRRGLLVIPDDTLPANFQTDAIYGRLISSVPGSWAGYNAWKLQATIRQFGA